MEAGFKLFNKVCKRLEKNRKKNQDGSEEDVLSDADGTDLTDSSSIDNKIGSDEESHDEKILLMKSMLNMILVKLMQNQLYVLGMVLSFHAWYQTNCF